MRRFFAAACITPVMAPALRSLLTGVLDYAGLFPPARLELPQAYTNFSSYLASPDRWMLAKFICPIGRLAQLTELVRQSPPSEPIEFCVLAGAEHSVDDAISTGMVPVLQAEPHMKLGAIELPAEPESISARMQGTKVARSLPETGVFFEIGWTGDWRARWTEAIARVKEVQSQVGAIGLKLRTGGVTADAFASTETVAGVIDLCRAAGVRLKFTAGLHHPIRLFHDSVQTKMHGFINVFVAGVLAHVHGMDARAIRLILECETPTDFGFDDYQLRWNTLRASVQRIEQIRKSGLISFGSCSFDEPRDDLKSLGWW